MLPRPENQDEDLLIMVSVRDSLGAILNVT